MVSRIRETQQLTMDSDQVGLLLLALLAIGIVGIAAGVMLWLRHPDDE
jgi:hypothetical protein